ncbi:hypothetical protein Lser_V15G11399 [Lactuca serriola]
MYEIDRIPRVCNNVLATEIQTIPGNLLGLPEYHFKRSQMGFFSRLSYVNLRTQEIFDKLVDLYAHMFACQWDHYRKFMDIFPPPPGVSPEIYIARCYISMWFIDLYVSNREAVSKLSFVAFNERYQGEFFRFSHEYDSYLTSLNASIRPTHVKFTLDNALYIPILGECIDVNNANPFGINNFTLEEELFHGITQIMKEKNLWRFTPLSSDARGRPWWLFDWHIKDCVCSWFPPDDNYTLEDLVLAYILGTACSPNLGVRDVDDWQYFSEGIVPHDPNPMNYDRVVDRRFYGSHEVRTMEFESDFSVPQIVSHGYQTRQMPRYKLIDWVYHHCVYLKMDNHERNNALERLLLA